MIRAKSLIVLCNILHMHTSAAVVSVVPAIVRTLVVGGWIWSVPFGVIVGTLIDLVDDVAYERQDDADVLWMLPQMCCAAYDGQDDTCKLKIFL